MASEDSQHLGRLPVVHRLGDLRDLDETWHCEVPAANYQIDDLRELGEVVSLRRSKWVLLEEGNDHALQVFQTEHLIGAKIFAMVVSAAVDVEPATAEEPSHLLKHVATRLALDDGERRLHLPSEPHRALPVDGDAETAFPIDETHQPSDGDEPFLLIARTSHIVTATHGQNPKTGV